MEFWNFTIPSRSQNVKTISKAVVWKTRRKIINIGRNINEIYQNDNYGNGEKNEYGGNYKCNSNSRVTFASSDVHDGPRTDISFLLLSMNHSFVHLGPRNATTNYPQGKL